MPTDVTPVLHVADWPAGDGTQSCRRCGMVLHKAGTGADPPWYPGQLVAEQEQGRAAVRYAPKGWPECEASPEAA